LPGDYQLLGTFCHSVLERLFTAGADLPEIEEAAIRAGAIFDERLPLDAAPLAQADRRLDSAELREQFVRATRVLVSTLRCGGYRIAGIETAVEGNALGKPLIGAIDCLAIRADGGEAVIDFKYSGRDKYRNRIVQGRAVQLATYAYSRSQGTRPYPAVAYMVLKDALLFTPAESAVDGVPLEQQLEGPSIAMVWRQFAEALVTAGGWLDGEDMVPARPIQPAESWPPGVELVLGPVQPANPVPEPCRYCEYGLLCGREELE
jgi:RecB family exonuclease